MIPKIIHYCWFGGNSLPELAQRCIASWRKFLPDYQIWQWSEGPLNENENEIEDSLPFTVYSLQGSENRLFDRRMVFDVNIIPYTSEAYRQKKYAFVSDYARFWIMYKYGGIYFDTDVEVIQPMDDIIVKGNFMGFEMDPDGKNTPGKYAPRYCFSVALGLGFGLSREHPIMQKMMAYYHGMEFKGAVMNPWFKTIVAYTTEALMKEGLQNVEGIQRVDDIYIYPQEYFAPINVISGKLHITSKTHSIHWYMGSWSGDGNKNKDKNKKLSLDSFKKMVRNVIPEWMFFVVNRIKRRRYKIKE